MTLLVKDVEPKGDRNEPRPTEDNLPELVEEPLVEACIALVRKNIRTIATTANKNNIGNYAELLISADDLSAENRELASRAGGEEILGGHWGHFFIFRYPLTEETTVEEVQRHFDGIADQLQTQPYTWAAKRNFADTLAMIYGSSAVTPEVRSRVATQTEFQDEGSGQIWNWSQMVEEAVGEGAYYDSESGYLYDNKGEYDKEKEFTVS